MNMLVSGMALLLACAVLVVYDAISFRDLVVKQLSIQAQIAGANSVSALIFNDPRVASETLQSLEASPDVLSAHIYTGEGRLFASYWRDQAGELDPPLAVTGNRIEAYTVGLDGVVLTRRIVIDGDTVGVISIRSTLQALYERLATYSAIVVFVLIVSLAAALFVSRVAQRTISRPLGALAAVARRVADQEGSAIRAETDPSAPDEIASLVHSFNEMLARVESRERALQQARELLEERVRQRTAALDASNKELEAFSYSVSHDLRAPLRHVVGFASLLEQHAGPSLDDRGRRYLTTMVEAANRMAKLVEDLLAFARLGRASLSMQRVDLGQVVEDAQAELLPLTASRRIEWNVGDLPVVVADPSLLRLVMVNLLSNAIKYTSTRDVARIEVGATQQENGDIVVSVRDNGVGFDMRYVDKLFGVFQRLHSAEEFEGTGIGLANVRRIVAKHGGETWAEGEPGRGATFFMSLKPAPPPDEQAEEARATQAAAPAGPVQARATGQG
jgi:signal transduction histidine kinase